MTLVLLQGATLLALVAGLIAWTSWVRNTHREVSSPERLNQIIVYAPDGAASEAEARALAVGIVGALGEHEREIALINKAASGDTGEIRVPEIAVGSASPALLTAQEKAAQVDLALEVFGTKVDAKGLRSWFAPSRQPGSLDLAIVFDKVAADGTRTGVASANYPEDRAYTFSLPVSGPPSSVARQIAMRFLQADYAKRDPFFAGLKGADFVTFWRVRREAAEIALRSAGGGTSPERLLEESSGSLADIAPLAQRYPQWRDVQQLAGYLASKSGSPEQALGYLQVAQSNVAERSPGAAPPARDPIVPTQATAARPQAASRQAVPKALQSEIARLKAEAARAESSIKPEAPAMPGQTLEGAIFAQPAISGAGIAALAERARQGRAVRVAVLAGHASAFPQFGARVANVANFSKVGEKSFNSGGYTDGIVGLIAALAPKATIEVISVLNEHGSATTAETLRSLGYIADQDGYDVVLVTFGPLSGKAVELLLARIGERAFVVLPAGNSGTSEELPMATNPTLIYVGSSDGNRRAEFSAFGSSVALYAPGRVTTYVSPDNLSTVAGGSYSSTIAAAVAANLAALHPGRLAPVDLRQQMLRQTKDIDGGRFLAIQQ